MKKVICFVLVFVVSILLFGCQNSVGYEQSVNDTKLSSVFSRSDSNSIEYTCIRDFSDGLAWVEYENSGNEYWGCINKSGELIFKFNYNDVGLYSSPQDYSNGYSYIETSNNEICVINKEGDICSRYNRLVSENEGSLTTTYYNYNDHEVAHGDGYTIVQKYYSDFDSSYYEYTIFDAFGNTLDKYKSQEETKVYFCGKGVFGFKESDGTNFYFTKTQKWTKYDISNTISGFEPEIKFYDDIALVDRISGEKDEFVIVDTNGNIKNVIIDNLDIRHNIYEEEIRNDFSIMHFVYNGISGDDRVLMSVDFKNGIAYQSKASYLSQLDVDWFDDYSGDTLLSFDDNAMIIKLVGEDGNDYIAVIDRTLNTVMQPTLVESYTMFNEDRFSLTNNGICEVYDAEGNVVYSLTEKGYEAYRNFDHYGLEYHDNVAIVCTGDDISSGKDTYDGTSFAFLDKEGEVVFESIDESMVVEKYVI